MWKKANLKDIGEVKAVDGKTYKAKEISGKLYLEEASEGESAPAPAPKPKPLMEQPFDIKPSPGKDHGRKDKPEPPRKMDDNAFRARLSSIMTDNKFDRVLRGRTRGKLDMGRLHKVPTKSTSVFQRKEARKNKHYNILFLVDLSGSMSDYVDYDDEEETKIRIAADATTYLMNNFEGLNIRTSVIGFSDAVYHIKDFNEPYGREAEKRVHNELQRFGGGGNNDYEAMMYAYTQFPRNDGENILVMLSDGAPTSSGYDSLTTYSRKGTRGSFKIDVKLDGSERNNQKHLHNLVRRHERVASSIGIGISQGGWQIPDHKIVSNIDELKPAMVEMLRKKVRRG